VHLESHLIGGAPTVAVFQYPPHMLHVIGGNRGATGCSTREDDVLLQGCYPLCLRYVLLFVHLSENVPLASLALSGWWTGE